MTMAAETDTFTQRQRAFHEAGHAVLAAQLGEQIERVSIAPSAAASSYVKFPAHAALAPGEQLVALLAGEEAQRRLGDADPVAAGDRERARQVLSAAAIDEARGQQMLADGRAQARQLLADAATWRQVEAVAAALLAEGALDAARFRAVMAGA
jgi:hypothetical protein